MTIQMLVSLKKDTRRLAVVGLVVFAVLGQGCSQLGTLLKQERASKTEFLSKSWIDTEGNFLSKSPYKGYSGRFVWLDDKGKGSKTKMRYKNGRITGKAVSTYSNGHPMERLHYAEGKKNGPAVWFYEEKNRMKVQGDYSRGRRVGQWKWYYKNGALSAEGTYIDHALEGLYTFYYKDGGVKRTIEYHRGVRHGNYESFYSNGAVKEKGRYNNRQKEGLWSSYNQKGDLVKQKTYKSNVLVEESLFDVN